MTLNLGNFKQAVDSRILQRGRQYFRAGHVIDLEEIDDGVWSAQVEGTEVYEVSVERDAQGELSWECTCPYDWGPVCCWLRRFSLDCPSGRRSRSAPWGDS